MVEVRSEPDQAVGLVRVTDLPEQHVRLLQRPAEHHALLVVDVVVGGPVHHQVLHVGELLGLGVDVTGLVASQVVVRCGQSQVQTTSDTVFCPLKCDGKLVIMKIS